MEYLEKVQKEIRYKWFKDHVTEIERIGNLTVLYWGKTGTNRYRVKYILSENNVFISGDIGEAVYTLTSEATLKDIKGSNLGYFTGKLRASSGDRVNFDQQKALAELKEYWNEYDMLEEDPNLEKYKSIVTAIENSHSIESYGANLLVVYETTTIDSDTISDVTGFGQRIPSRFVAYWLGLQMIIEQLDEWTEQSYST